MAMPDVLSDRALGRATLARQLLLERSAMDPVDAVAHLVGLQAQEPPDPYLALWSRLDGFDPEVVSRALEDRRLVRIVVMRGTIHLVTAEDALVIRPLMQPVLDAELTRHSQYKDHLTAMDLGPIMTKLRPLVAEEPRSPRELRAVIAAAYPDLDAGALAYACRNLLDLVQVPPRGVWGKTSQVRQIPLDTWVGRPIAEKPSIDEVALRYFGAFGPAAVADLSAWCRLTGMREVVDRVVDRLRPFRDERGRELWDLPDAPRPDPETPAPVRFLPEYDNVLLSHADRRRFLNEERRVVLGTGSRAVHGVVLLDGEGCGTWRTEQDDDGGVTLTVDHAGRIAQKAASSLRAEGRRFLKLLAPGAAAREVVLAPITP
jgi:Winged helix DNA-binding domain